MFPRVIIALSLCFGTEVVGQHIVISQIYGGGGNTGASYRSDFIELFNPNSNTVIITGWSVQYASAAGMTWQVTPLTGTIAGGRYLLVQQSSGGPNGINLPAADIIGSVSMSGTAGKVALVDNSLALSGSCPLSNAAVVDLVGYGSTATCAEGNPTPAHTSATSVRRAFDGCVDMDDNASDFFIGTVTPRNSSSPAHSCDTSIRAYAIHEIQGTNSVSPLAGESVTTTTNIVTARRNNGFFIQAYEAEEDGNGLSSEGIFVLTTGTSGTNASIGHSVVVTGVATEFRPPGDVASPSQTQIHATHIRFVSAENTLPAAVTVTAGDLQPGGGHEQLERFEGMRVAINAMLATSPTDGFVNEANATATSSGVFYAVLAGPGPFREPGIHVLDPLPPNSPCCAPRFDGNPEILRIDSNGQLGATPLDVLSGMVLGNFAGVLYYETRRYTVLPDPTLAPQVLLIPPAPAAPPAPTISQVTVASLNLERFYDTADHANVADVVLTPTAYSNRLHKAGLLLRDVMHSPDIVGLAEVENLGAMEDLARVTSSSYGAWLFAGNDPGGINVGFLVNTSRVTVIEVTQHGRNATFTHPATGMPATLHDRPPLLLRAVVPELSGTNAVALTIIMNHVRSMLEIDDSATGAFVRAKRRAQAEFLAQLAQQRQLMDEQVVVMGDFNAFEFNDGYADVMGTITGSPASSNTVVLASADLVNPNLHNLIETLPPSQRYSYVFEGMPQALDHILVSQSLRPRVSRFLYVRGNADSHEVTRNDPESAQRISDHDPAMAYITLGTLPRIRSVQRLGEHVEVEGQGAAMRNYEIERSSDLQQWSQIGSAAADQAGRFSFRDLSPVSGAAFYRLRSD